jgi:hypothetical protein
MVLAVDEKKLFAAMAKDEAESQAELSRLLTARDRPVMIRIHDGSQIIEVKIRELHSSELATYRAELMKINPELGNPMAEPPRFTPEQLQKIQDISDKYILLATGWPKDALEKLDSEKLRAALLKGIMQASQFSKEDLEKLENFRQN